MADYTILWTVHDPRGLSITLVEDVWRHIIVQHTEMADYSESVQHAVQDPDEIYFDPIATETRSGPRIYWHYKIQLYSPGKKQKYVAVIVKVVVEADADIGYVQTAILTTRIQSRLVLEWKK